MLMAASSMRVASVAELARPGGEAVARPEDGRAARVAQPAGNGRADLRGRSSGLVGGPGRRGTQRTVAERARWYDRRALSAQIVTRWEP
ncbi:hypothetical protein Sru01_05360 [Sphaerisporangium rufum]|uniref:Uncharacterized protein n=1 Tax=Sphaerisporangium rufum TaxID=1381558 RepID=A0A919UX80_9ACTN|nr:hypothetical protein Sru01_05360 [Sphaerisporangium rufum]